MTRRVRLVATIGVAVLALVPTPADAAPCADVAAYPGDAAPKPAIAQWMAHGASRASLPRELPVMGALVASGLTNLRGGDADSVGYFQMRVGIWNKDAYAGYPDDPSLQVKWFIDQSASVRQARIAASQADPAIDERGWGAWIADVLRPAENDRHRYQLRLAEARALVGPPCTPASGTEPPPPPPRPGAAADRLAPALELTGQRRQRALLAGAIVLAVRCPAEPCTTSATAAIALPRARNAPKIALGRRTTAGGQARRLRFVLGRGVRALLRAALRSRGSVKVSVRVVASDLAGNRRERMRTVRLTR